MEEMMITGSELEQTDWSTSQSKEGHVSLLLLNIIINFQNHSSLFTFTVVPSLFYVKRI